MGKSRHNGWASETRKRKKREEREKEMKTEGGKKEETEKGEAGVGIVTLNTYYATEACGQTLISFNVTMMSV